MKKILFIDEEKELQAVVLKLFPKQFYRVIAASDGPEGLQKCRNEEFDLIILDYRMPKLDGVKFYQQIREMHEVRKNAVTPMLFVTAYLEELKAKIPKWEKCDFMEKPYEPDELLKRVNRLFGISHSAPVAVGDKISLNAGEVLFDIGDPPDSVFLVVSGALSAFTMTPEGELKKILQIEAGEIIGEVAVLTGVSRIIRVVADEKSELISIPSEKIVSLVNSQPKWIKLMLDAMSKRLQESIKQIS